MAVVVFKIFWTKVPFGLCKSISGKENVFMCLVAFRKMFRKIFSGVWLYSWKYHRKHIFYLLLTFSHIFSVVKRIYNIIYSSIQKHKQNLEKKSSNPVTFSHIFSVAKQQKHKQTQKHKHFLGSTRGCNCAKHRANRDRREGEITIGAVLRVIVIDDSRDRDWRFARSRSMVHEIMIDTLRNRDRCEGEIAIGMVLCVILVIPADDLGNLGNRSFGRSRWTRLSLWSDRSFGRSLYFRGWVLSFSCSLSLLRVTRK